MTTLDKTPTDTAMVRVVFTPSGLSGTVAAGTDVLAAARHLGVDLDSVCGGRGICGRCAVAPASGSFPKWAMDVAADAHGARNGVEDTYAGRRGLADGLRLGCQLALRADAVVDVPASSQVHRPVVRKSINLGDLQIDPVVHLYYVTVPAAELGLNGPGQERGADASAAERLLTAIAHDHGVGPRADGPGEPLELPVSILRQLHRATASPTEGTTVAVWNGRRVAAVWPGYVDAAYGVAVDIGSTTVAGHLLDLATGEVVASAGVMNPQIRFGEDLMSRVSYVMMNPGGDVALTTTIRQALDDLVGSLVAGAPPDRAVTRDLVLDVVLVGNPIMHHIVLGIDPTPLGGAPFELAVSTAVHGSASDVGIDAPNASLYLAPCIAGHVGADTAGAILSEGPHRSSAVQLLIDVGTNAEIVLGNDEHLYAASSPTGPAFEGAQVSCGQRATVGAIERVRIDRTTLEPRFKVIGSDLWSDEPDFDAAVAAAASGRGGSATSGGTGISGVCGSGIIEVIGELYLSGIIGVDGMFDGTLADTNRRVVADGRTFSYVLCDAGEHGRAPDEPRLCITQNDVRAIQLAKGALRAGIELLREISGFERLDDVRLAGAFGAHIDPLYALVLGLVPDVDVTCVHGVGNAAGAGAARALLSRAQRAEMEATVASVTKIETATEPRFQQHFVDAMGFPHSSAPTPLLAQVITLPERKHGVGADGQDGGRRRGRRVRNPTESTESPITTAATEGES